VFELLKSLLAEGLMNEVAPSPMRNVTDEL
jgi:hypothetical protein